MLQYEEWSMTEVDTLRQMARDDHTASQIAARLNRTRSAVVGKCLRLKIKLGQTRASPKGKTKSTAAPERAYQPKERLPPMPPPQAAIPLVDSNPKLLKDHRRGECRWPISTPAMVNGSLDGEYLFCCAPVEQDHPNYCAHHRARSIRARQAWT